RSKEETRGANTTQYPRWHAHTAKGYHMDRTSTNLDPLKGHCRKTPPAMRQALQHDDLFSSLQQVCGTEQATQSRTDHDGVYLSSPIMLRNRLLHSAKVWTTF